jgi:hypothetical protein
VKRLRRYASAFEWHDRRRKERGIVEELLKSPAYVGPVPVSDLRSPDEDPPDVVGTLETGHQVAFEVTELVDQDAARMNAQGKPVYCDWERDEVIEALATKLEEKDSKDYHGGPYDEAILVVHTDERTLAPAKYVPTVAAHVFPKPQLITQAYLVFSYDPATSGYPVVKLLFKG